jgi:hypothetical protein
MCRNKKRLFQQEGKMKRFFRRFNCLCELIVFVKKVELTAPPFFILFYLENYLTTKTSYPREKMKMAFQGSIGGGKINSPLFTSSNIFPDPITSQKKKLKNF